MLVALRWMSQGGRSTCRHSLTLLLCTDCTAVWAPPLSDRVADLGPISPTCVLPLLDNTALMYYVFHIVRSRSLSNCAKSVIPNQLFRLDPTTASQLAGRLSHPSQHQSSLEWLRSSFFRLYLSASSSPHPHRHQLPFTNGSSCSLHSRGPSGMSRRSRSRSRGPRLGKPPVCGLGSRCARH